MIEEQGTVVSLRGKLAEVRTQRRGGCDGCDSSAGCGTALVDRFLGRRTVTLRARNPVGARVGDRVVIGVREGGLLAAALAAYLVPILGLIAGGVLGQWLGQPGPPPDPSAAGADTSALVGALLGFMLALFWLRRYSAGRARRTELDPVVLRRLGGEAIPGAPSCGVDHC
jgi:sigma-E factor negative regulatory protein RseC